MKWDPLEDAKRRPRSLGRTRISRRKIDLEIAQDLTDAYSNFDEAGQLLRDRLDNLINTLAKWNDGLKQTAPLYEKADFGLNAKTDSQKIAKARKSFFIVFNVRSVYDKAYDEFGKIQKQYKELMKTKLPF